MSQEEAPPASRRMASRRCSRETVAVPRGGVRAGHPLHRLLAALELRRIVANEENVALLLRRAERRLNADIRAATIRQIAEGGDDPRHVADVADMLLLAGHRVNDDGALQSDLKLYGRA